MLKHINTASMYTISDAWADFSNRIKLTFQVTYDLGVEVKGQTIECTCQKVVLIDLTVVDPFQIVTQIKSMQVGANVC